MRWLADECVAASLVRALRRAGQDVLYVAEFAASVSDVAVAGLASEERRLLLTADKDFGELVVRRAHSVPGLVLMRIDPANSPLMTTRLMEAIDQFGDRLVGRYVVVEEQRFRSRIL